MIRRSLKKAFILIIFLVFFLSNLNLNGLSKNQVIENNITIQNTLQFNIISPENETTFNIQPSLQYFVSISEADVSFYINGSEIFNFYNNSLLLISYRGSYNLTGTANYNGSEVIHQVFFNYFPEIKLDFYSNSVFYNDWLFPHDFNESIPCFNFDETIDFYIQPNEMRNTLNITVKYKRSNYEFVLGSSNFSWINDTTLKLTVEPYQENFTMHKLLFNITSTLSDENASSIFYFYRAVFPPLIVPSQYETFTSEPLSGVAYGHFDVWRSILQIVNISVYLDGDVIYSIYNRTGLTPYSNPSFSGILTVEINTTRYENGPHLLKITAIDFFNLTSTEEYLLQFNNVPTTPPNDTETSPMKWTYALFSVILLSIISEFYLRKRTKS